MQGWMLSWKNPDPELMFSTTYLKEETAYQTAATSIKDWAADDLVDLAADTAHADPNDEERLEQNEKDSTLLREVLNLIEQKKYKEAYEEWREYADEADPREDVMIEDTNVVDE